MCCTCRLESSSSTDSILRNTHIRRMSLEMRERQDTKNLVPKLYYTQIEVMDAPHRTKFSCQLSLAPRRLGTPDQDWVPTIKAHFFPRLTLIYICGYSYFLKEEEKSPVEKTLMVVSLNGIYRLTSYLIFCSLISDVSLSCITVQDIVEIKIIFVRQY